MNVSVPVPVPVNLNVNVVGKFKYKFTFKFKFKFKASPKSVIIRNQSYSKFRQDIDDFGHSDSAVAVHIGIQDDCRRNAGQHLQS